MMLVRFSVTINDAFQWIGSAIMNKTVVMVLTKKDAGLVRVPARNSGNARRMVLKGHGQLAHMRIRYHFIANLRITETRSILFLTKYDKTT